MSDLLENLAAAETFRDIYSLDFPHIVAPIKNTERFGSFWHGSTDFFGTKGAKNDAGEFDWQEEPPGIQEPIRLIQEFDKNARADRVDFDIHGPADFHRSGITQTVHTDGAHIPKMRVYIAASKTPTWVVAHHDILEIFERHAPRILDLRFDEEFLWDFTQTSLMLSDYFSGRARPVPANHICAITGATHHFRPANADPERVFMRLRSFEIQK